MEVDWVPVGSDEHRRGNATMVQNCMSTARAVEIIEDSQEEDAGSSPSPKTLGQKEWNLWCGCWGGTLDIERNQRRLGAPSGDSESRESVPNRRTVTSP